MVFANNYTTSLLSVWSWRLSYCRTARLVIAKQVVTVAVALVCLQCSLLESYLVSLAHLNLSLLSACLQSVRCDNFHEGLSRRSGVIIGNHLLKRLQRSTLVGRLLNEATERYELQPSVKPKNILIGRASFSPQRKRSRFADVDDIE